MEIVRAPFHDVAFPNYQIQLCEFIYFFFLLEMLLITFLLIVATFSQLFSFSTYRLLALGSQHLSLNGYARNRLFLTTRSMIL